MVLQKKLLVMKMKSDYNYLHKTYNIEDVQIYCGQDYSREYETITCKYTGKEIPVPSYVFNNEPFESQLNDVCKKCKMCNWSMRN